MGNANFLTRMECLNTKFPAFPLSAHSGMCGIQLMKQKKRIPNKVILFTKKTQCRNYFNFIYKYFSQLGLELVTFGQSDN